MHSIQAHYGSVCNTSSKMQSLKRAHALTKIARTNQNIQIQTAQQMCMLRASLSPRNASISPVPKCNGVFFFLFHSIYIYIYVFFTWQPTKPMYRHSKNKQKNNRKVACIHSYVQLNVQQIAESFPNQTTTSFTRSFLFQ